MRDYKLAFFSGGAPLKTSSCDSVSTDKMTIFSMYAICFEHFSNTTVHIKNFSVASYTIIVMEAATIDTSVQMQQRH